MHVFNLGIKLIITEVVLLSSIAIAEKQQSTLLRIFCPLSWLGIMSPKQNAPEQNATRTKCDGGKALLGQNATNE